MKKWLIIVLCAVLALLILPAIYLNTQQGLPVGERFFLRDGDSCYRADDANEISFTRSDHLTEFVILLNGQSSSAALTRDGDHVRIEFDDGAVVSGDWNGKTLVNLDGELANLLSTESVYAVSPSSSDPAAAALVQKGLLSIALCQMDAGMSSAAGSLILVILGAILYIFGLLNVFWPQGMILLLSHLHYNYQELSVDSGRRAQIFGGIIAILGDIACMYSTLLFR